jgi:hypothetical protein
MLYMSVVRVSPGGGEQMIDLPCDKRKGMYANGDVFIEKNMLLI